MNNKYAMIFAAGLGTRLGNFTNTKPKALLDIQKKPLLFYCLTKLKKYNYTHVVINVHHFANQIIDYLKNNTIEGLNIYISDETNLLLDTGGGLFNAKVFFKNADNILIHNVDIISNIDILALENEHNNSNNLATLAVSKRNTTRYFLFDNDMNLKGWKNTLTNETKVFSSSCLSEYAFSGIHLVSTKIFDLEFNSNKFSLTDFYLQYCEKYNIRGFVHGSDTWVDVGKIDNIPKAQKIINSLY